MIEAFSFHPDPLNFLAMLLLSMAPKKRLWPEKDICAGPLAKVCGKLQREPVEAGRQCIAQGEKSEDLFTGMQMMRARKSGVTIRGITSCQLGNQMGSLHGKQLAAVRSESLFVSFDNFHKYGMSFSDHLM